VNGWVQVTIRSLIVQRALGRSTVASIELHPRGASCLTCGRVLLCGPPVWIKGEMVAPPPSSVLREIERRPRGQAPPAIASARAGATPRRASVLDGSCEAATYLGKTRRRLF
jgi:hypothetical protein